MGAFLGETILTMNNADSNDTCMHSPLQSGCSAVWQGDYFTFYLIHCSAIVEISISAVSCILIIAVIVKRYSANNEYGFSERFPFYVALIDLVWGICHITDHTLLLTNKVYPGPTSVIIISSLNVYAFFIQQFMYGSVSVYTYLTVVKGTCLNLGRWDWKMTLSCLVSAAGCAAFLQRQGALGIARYWVVGQEGDRVGWVYIAGITAVVTMIQSLCTIFAYDGIRKTVLKYKSGVVSAPREDGRSVLTPLSAIHNGYHEKAARCLSTYVAIGIFLYLPFSVALWIALTIHAAGYDLFTIDIVGILLIYLFITPPNLSGFVNGIGYFRNYLIKKDRRGRKK